MGITGALLHTQSCSCLCKVLFLMLFFWVCVLRLALAYVKFLPPFLMLSFGFAYSVLLLTVHSFYQFLMLSLWLCVLGFAVAYAKLLPWFLKLVFWFCVFCLALAYAKFLLSFLMLFGSTHLVLYLPIQTFIMRFHFLCKDCSLVRLGFCAFLVLLHLAQQFHLLILMVSCCIATLFCSL